MQTCASIRLWVKWNIGRISIFDFAIDEPTTGLHGSDVARLMSLFNRLTDDKNTIIIIEHNMDVVCQADWIIDMGPSAGRDGGQV